MEIVLEEIDRALDAKLYFLAIALSLAIPDICAALQAQNGETSPSRYRNWYDSNLAAKYPNLTASDFWSLRCGVLHQGRFGHPNSQYGRVLFTIPNPQNSVFHNNVINDALNLDAVTFCRDVVGAARDWFENAKGEPSVQQHLPNLIQFRPNGIAPYMIGIPLIS